MLWLLQLALRVPRSDYKCKSHLKKWSVPRSAVSLHRLVSPRLDNLIHILQKAIRVVEIREDTTSRVINAKGNSGVTFLHSYDTKSALAGNDIQ